MAKYYALNVVDNGENCCALVKLGKIDKNGIAELIPIDGPIAIFNDTKKENVIMDILRVRLTLLDYLEAQELPDDNSAKLWFILEYGR
jgi:hypothetical protein